MTNEPNDKDGSSHLFPVSMKAVVVDSEGSIPLLMNERDEWELPGGKLELGEEPESCLRRELHEELGVSVSLGNLIDCWVYEVRPAVSVLIVTYSAIVPSDATMKVSREHKSLALFAVDEIAPLRMPAGYKRSIFKALATRP